MEPYSASSGKVVRASRRSLRHSLNTMKISKFFPLFLLFHVVAFAQAPQKSSVPLLKSPGQESPDCPGQNKIGTDSWASPAEAANYCRTPRYDETYAYIRRVAAAAPKQVRLDVFGKTGEGRDLLAVIVSKDGVFDTAELHRQKRPIVLIQNSIHAGEMDGKDSCLALLRDMLVSKTRAALLDRAVVIILPIYNADGHERFGRYNRINQNGPDETGWRTQGMNLNLNRDYLKADTPETRAFLRLWNKWLPDYFVDDHVTDGADYQYDVTYGVDSSPDVPAQIAAWQRESVAPYLEQSVTAAGHKISPLIWLTDGADPSKGIARLGDLPRYGTGYIILQNRPAMLVEIHMLKDYKTRVTGNYEILRALLELINRDADKLVAMNLAADEATIAAGKSFDAGRQFSLRVEPTGQTRQFHYLTYKFKRSLSEVSGGVRIEYTDEPLELDIPMQTELAPTLTVIPPAAYIVPASWTSVIDVLAAHGLKFRRTTKAWTGEVETYRCDHPQWLAEPFEGHHLIVWPQRGKRLSADPVVNTPGAGEGTSCHAVTEKMEFAAGSVVVPLDQRAAKVAIHWLEPIAPDSAVTWGYFDAIFEQKEYGEDYVLEKLAREMMAADSNLKAEFETKVATDPKFAADPQARLNFFYQRSPWWDPQLGLYPVGRLKSLEGVPLQ
jgi:murein tripeptide amidase MpaA